MKELKTVCAPFTDHLSPHCLFSLVITTTITNTITVIITIIVTITIVITNRGVGDLNVIVPNKFVHFSGPSDTHRDADGYPALTPDDYIGVFKDLGVTDIIRLNKKCYDKTRFTKHGVSGVVMGMGRRVNM